MYVKKKSGVCILVLSTPFHTNEETANHSTMLKIWYKKRSKWKGLYDQTSTEMLYFDDFFFVGEIF